MVMMWRLFVEGIHTLSAFLLLGSSQPSDNVKGIKVIISELCAQQ